MTEFQFWLTLKREYKQYLNWTIGDDNKSIITSDGLIGRKGEDGLPAELYN